MGCVDCGGDNNWDHCNALEIKKDWIQQKANEVKWRCHPAAF
jgi:hypothetical protein